MTSDRVLVCDPSPQSQRALRVILREAGYEVVLTATGRDALAAAARERPRAVILELALPDLDGIEVCRRLRRRVEAPIVVLSALDDEEKKIAALMCGAGRLRHQALQPARAAGTPRGTAASGAEPAANRGQRPRHRPCGACRDARR